MIAGTIEQLSAHFKPEIVAPILNFIQRQDFNSLPSGKHPVANGIFAIVIKTNSRDLKGQQFEAHRQNLDLHYLVSGKEVLGFTNGPALHISTPYDSAGDYLLYHPPQNYSLLGLTEKQFALFYPEDAHCAQGHLQEENSLVKVVFKIPISLVKSASPQKSTVEAIKINPIANLEEAIPILWDHDQKNQKINFPNSFPHLELFEKNIRPEHASGSAASFLIYEQADASGQEKLVGSLILRIKENPYRRKKFGEIWYIYLEPECRGKGYGKKLLEFADEYFKKQGCSYAFAGIAAHNPASNLLFEKAGYSKTRFILEKEY